MVDWDGGVSGWKYMHDLGNQVIGHQVLYDLVDGTIVGWDGGGEQGCLWFWCHRHGGGAEKVWGDGKVTGLTNGFEGDGCGVIMACVV